MAAARDCVGAVMRRETSGQLSLADGLVAPGLGANARLRRIEALLDWPALGAELADIHAAPTGRPSYPVGLLLRALLLQAWYGLSDPAAEEAFRDRLSFRRFLGVALDQPTPDPNTLWRFREELARRGLAERLLAQVADQLAARGLVLKQGTLLDATVVAANVAPKNTRQDGRPVDPDARWTKRGRRAVLGYKAHLAVDQGSGLVRDLVVTGAEVHDSRQGSALVQGDEAAVYADKAYDAQTFRDCIRAAGAADRVMHAGRRNRKLKPWQTWMNRALAPVRGAVERVFGTLKRSYRAPIAPGSGTACATPSTSPSRPSPTISAVPLSCTHHSRSPPDPAADGSGARLGHAVARSRGGATRPAADRPAPHRVHSPRDGGVTGRSLINQ